MVTRLPVLFALTALALALGPRPHADAEARRAAATAPAPVLDTVNLPPGWQWPATAAMHERGARCLRALDAAGVGYQRVQEPVGRVVTPVVVPDMQFGAVQVRPYVRERSQVMDCHMALALAQQAPLLEQLGVRTLFVSRYYHGRRARLGGRSVNMWSRHALGLAVDVRGLRLRSGRTLWVERDGQLPWLRGLAQALIATGGLRAVVTPYNDVRHRDHFHLSARMTLDDAAPDLPVDVRQLPR